MPDGGILNKFQCGAGGLHDFALAIESLAEVSGRLDKQGVNLLKKESVKWAGPFYCNSLNPLYKREFLVEFVEEIG